MRLSEDRAWHKLLHYRKGLFGWRSDADSATFFLAPDGAREPQTEIEATIGALLEPAGADPDAHAQCRFPARYRWLRQRLGPDHWGADVDCPKLRTWMEALDPGGVSVVFATAYVNNPGSAYGHTFLRLHRRGTRQDQPLLAYTINFTAVVTTDNAFVYAWKGLTGGFEGRYSTMPFYMKVQEYNNLESRDLWEYRLRFDAEQAVFLALHAWELGGTYFDYYFFTENCSFQVLTLLEAADPSLRLSERFGGWTVPGDTVRALLEVPGLVVDVRGRASYLGEMLYRRSRLTSDEVRLAEALATGPGPHAALDRLPAQRQARALEAAHSYARYRHGFSADVSSADRETERRLLIRRGRLGVPAAIEQAPPRVDRLELGHRSFSLAMGGGRTGDSGFGEIDVRPVLHDLLDSPRGYPPETQLEMAHTRLRWERPSDGLFVERFDAVRITSLTPMDRWIRKPSWKVGAGWQVARELGCAGWSCGIGAANLGFGPSLALSPDGRRHVAYSFAELDVGLGGPLRGDYRLGGGGSVGLLLDFSRWRVQMEAAYLRYPLGDERTNWRAELAQSVRLAQDAALRLVLRRVGSHAEAGAFVQTYF